MAEIRLDRDTVARLDLAGAVETAADRIGDFFPSRAAFDSARQTPAFPKTLASQLSRGLDAPMSEQVLVPKWGGASRPAADVAVQIRVVYDALIDVIRSNIPTGVINWSPVGEARKIAERSVLGKGTAYVVVTDVANFYEHVSHRLLADELLELTAEDELVEALEELLGSIQSSDFGLPQGPPASGFLADVYLSIADRRLARAGLDFIRYSDDYRISASSWRGGMRAQQTLERYLRDLGLNVNPRKTWTPKRELYEAWVDMAPDDLGDASAEHEDGESEENGATAGPYEWEPVDAARELAKADPKVEQRLEAACENPAIWGTPQNTEQSRRALAAIRSLAGTGSNRLPKFLPSILRSFPHLTRDVCIALRRRMQTGREKAALDAVSEAIKSEAFVYDWQLGWLLHVGVPASHALPVDLKAAATAALSNTELPWFVRGRSAVLLATEGEINVDDEYRAIRRGPKREPAGLRAGGCRQRSTGRCSVSPVSFGGSRSPRRQLTRRSRK